MKRTAILTKILAGIITAVISPIAAFSISMNLDHISGAINAAAQYIRSHTEETALIPVNNGEVLLYHKTGEVYITPLPGFTAGSSEAPAQTASVLSQNISEIQEDLTVFTSQEGTITRMTFRPELNTGYIHLQNGGQIRNTTGIADLALVHESRQPLNWRPAAGSEPEVLIIHTHTTESFRLSHGEYYDPDYSFRTIDSSNNIVAVGAKIAEEIAEAGFTVIHDGTIHDYPVFSGAYGRSAQTVQAILEEFPSIKVILDIHRDAIESNGAPVAAIADINNREAAQVMIISPADNGEWGVPDFMENFRFASRLQSQIEKDHPGLTRAVLFQYCNYNLHLSPGALLIEIGSHGNTLEQALYTGELVGQSIAGLLLSL
jgi:stage II sporulation protein P